MRIGPDLRERAIARLLEHSGGGDPGHTRRFMDFARANQVVLDHLWAIPDSRSGFAAVVLAVPAAGRSAMIFTSQSSIPHERAAAAALLQVVAGSLHADGILLAQALLDPHEQLAREIYLAGGFTELATLSYLERPLRSRSLPIKPVWPSNVTIETCERIGRDELIATLDATYEQTLDCPGLRGHRSTGDILDGHRAQGASDPRLWTLLRINGRPAGVLLLNPAADQASIELVYLGLSAHARGRGLGLQLLRHGLHLVAGRRERLMTLAVDESNAPALRLYARENFRAVMRRAAFIRGLRVASPSPSTAT